jgi:hypothetical protein
MRRAIGAPSLRWSLPALRLTTSTRTFMATTSSAAPPPRRAPIQEYSTQPAFILDGTAYQEEGERLK